MSIVDNYFKLLNEKREYLVKIFANLIIQLVVTFYVAFKFTKLDLSFFMVILAFIVQISIIFLLHMTSNMGIQFLMFLVFSSINGLFVSFFVGNNAKTMKIMKDVIKIIGIVFVAMFTLGGLLLAGGIAFGTWALIFMIVLLLLFLLYSWFGTNMQLMYIFGCAIFTALIAIDTNMILQDNYEEKNTPINASMRYYLDILNLYKLIFRRKLGK
jgi:FtsH-binding integral membrane protein